MIGGKLLGLRVLASLAAADVIIQVKGRQLIVDGHGRTATSILTLQDQIELSCGQRKFLDLNCCSLALPFDLSAHWCCTQHLRYTTGVFPSNRGSSKNAIRRTMIARSSGTQLNRNIYVLVVWSREKMLNHAADFAANINNHLQQI